MLTGVVTDPAGAAVTGSSVNLVSREKSRTWTAKTGNDGEYTFVGVPVGAYYIYVETPGFQKALRDFVLETQTNVNFTLSLGNVSETVENERNSVPYHTLLAGGLSGNTFTDISVDPYGYRPLLSISPGVVDLRPSYGTAHQPNTIAWPKFAVNGTQQYPDTFLTDGVADAQPLNTVSPYITNPDAIQSVSFTSASAPAERGNFINTIIHSTVKTGGNAWHSDVFGYLQNDKLDANEWSNNFLGLPRASIRWSDFGGAIGGPLKRDQVFVFVDYQQGRFNTPANVVAMSVLTNRERTGDFSGLFSQGIQLDQPRTNKSTSAGIPYPDNVIPIAELSSTAMALVSSRYYPAPTVDGLVNNQRVIERNQTRSDQGDIRLQVLATPEDELLFRYSRRVQSDSLSNSDIVAYDSSLNSRADIGGFEY